MKRWLGWGRTALLAAVVAMLAIPVMAQIEGWVMVVRKQGVVENRPSGSNVWSRVVAQKRLGALDWARTGPDGTAQVRMSDDSVLAVGPKTTVQVKEFVLAAQKRSTQIAVERGSVRAKVARFQGNSTFQVSTPNAVLAAQGTDFMVDVTGPDQAAATDDGWVQAQFGGDAFTRAAVFEGNVNVNTSNGQTANLGPGDTVIVDAAGNLQVNPPNFPFPNAQQFTEDTPGLGDVAPTGSPIPYDYSTLYDFFGSNETGLTADTRTTSTGTEGNPGPVLINPQAETTGTLIIELNSSPSSPSQPSQP